MILKLCSFIIILQISSIFCVDLKQIENDLSAEEESHSLGAAFYAIERLTNPQSISKEIVNEMRNKFGGKWNCFVFIDRNSNGALDLEGLLKNWFIYKGFEIIIFKLDAQGVTQTWAPTPTAAATTRGTTGPQTWGTTRSPTWATATPTFAPSTLPWYTTGYSTQTSTCRYVCQ